MKTRTSLILSLLLLLLLPLAAPAEDIRAAYLYTLSDFTGPIPYNWVSLTADPQRHEIYVADAGDRTVRIFNESGMEVYRFGDDENLGSIAGIALGGNGDIFLLSRANGASTVIRSNFRGEPQEKLSLKELPPAYATDFVPDAIFGRDDKLYLVDRNFMKVVVTDLTGKFVTGYDLAALVGYDEKKRQDSGIVGFNVDRQGNLLFTIPVAFSAFVVAPDGKVRAFGTRGSSPGKFNVVSGIAADDNGNFYVTDTLRCVVMIFDREFNFMKVAVTGPDGVFTTGYDLAAILGFDDKKRRDSGIVGFNLDRQGNMLFTVPVYFSAYIVSPDKKVQAFGNRGSSPGKFNVVSGIAADDNGNIYVTDTLRCVVMIFDKELNFRTEFGFRGLEPGNLIAPMELAVNNDRVYVAQTRSRGVSVYRVFAE